MVKSFSDQLRALIHGPVRPTDVGSIDYATVTEGRGPLLEAAGKGNAFTFNPNTAPRASSGIPTMETKQTYQRFAYQDHLSTEIDEHPVRRLGLPGSKLDEAGDKIVRYADGADDASDNPAFLLDCRIFIQGVDVSPYISGGVSIDKNTIDGENQVSFVLDNEGDRFVWSERNLNDLYNEDRNFDEDEEGESDIRDLFTSLEEIKKRLYAYKSDGQRNPRIRSATNVPQFARFDLAPNRAVFNRMDPIRVFTLYPFRVPGLQEDDGTDSLWIPEFVGYVESVNIEDDDINGLSKVTVRAMDFGKAVLWRMRISSDPITGISNPLDRMGFAKPTFANQAGDKVTAEFDPNTGQSFEADSPQSTQGTRRSLDASDRFFNPDDTLFYDEVIGSIYGNQFYPNQPMEGVVKDLLVFKPSTRADKLGNQGVRGVELGGTFLYDSASQNKDASRAFLGQWHSFCLFGAKRRPWTRTEMEVVGAATTTDGTHAPNNVRLWFLLPEEGTGPRNVADLSAIGANMAHAVTWSNRLEVLRNIVATIDYRMMITPCGDLVCEFPFADFRPEDFGEDYQTAFRVRKGLINSEFGDEQDSPLSALIVTTSLGKGAANPANDPTGIAQSVLQSSIAFSPYITARYGFSSETEQMPFLLSTDKAIAQQRAVIEFQKKNSRCNALTMTFTYRPFLLPNRPLHHLRRTRMGIAVSISSSLEFGTGTRGSTQVGLECVRLWTGYYRKESDYTALHPSQKKEMDDGGLDTPQKAQGIDTAASGSERSVELQVYASIMAGESLPASARVGWGAKAIVAPASGVYVLDPQLLQAAADRKIGDTPSDVTARNDVGVADTPFILSPPRPDDHQFKSDPLRVLVRTSRFGPRNHPVTGKYKMHNGVDYSAQVGTPVLAVDDGTITISTFQSFNGNYLALETADDYRVLYLHLDQPGLPKGTKVKAGQVIGYAGSTGRSTGGHLHLEVQSPKYAKQTVDPEPMMPGASRALIA